MVAGIELGKEYAQICVKTDSMKDAESVTKIVGAEDYRIPVENDLEKAGALQEFFRKLWKMLTPYAGRESLEYLVFCLEENSEAMREKLSEIVQIYNLSADQVRFIDKEESFCSYVFHQSADLLAQNALLIENHGGEKSKWILHKRQRTVPAVAEVRNISEKSLENVFAEHAISSVFLVGDDFEEDWIQGNLRFLKNGKRIFAGKNLYVKGACYRAMDLKAQRESYLYLGAEKVCCNIALKTLQKGQEEFASIVEGGKNWYESDTVLEVLLLDQPELEFAIIPINGSEKKTMVIRLNELPNRPPKTTRLRLELNFLNPSHVKLTVKDLGFGELFPPSDMVYEGELQWEQ